MPGRSREPCRVELAERERNSVQSGVGEELEHVPFIEEGPGAELQLDDATKTLGVVRRGRRHEQGATELPRPSRRVARTAPDRRFDHHQDVT